MNKVFIATSLDGGIADKNGGIDWLHSFPNPDNLDMGYSQFMDSVDALIMGKNTFLTVCGFGIDWPYNKPVFVLSNSLKTIPDNLRDKVFLINGELKNVIREINQKGFHNLYIDGGKTIQGFLNQNLIDELIITIIPIILGDNIPLYANILHQLKFKCIQTILFPNGIVQNRFVKL